MSIAVVGAGWAGLAAALRLRDAGHRVTVYEASRTMGGRARRLDHPDFDHPLDNGQHILLGAYAETLALMRRLDCDPGAGLLRSPLHLESADGAFRLHAPRLPAPLHALAALLRARGLGHGGRRAVLRLMLGLRRTGWRVPADWTVRDLLDRHGQPEAPRRLLWAPLCLAALNTPPESASAGLFACVLRDSLGGRRAASDLLLPRVDLGALWPEAAAHLCDLRLGCPARKLEAGRDGIRIDGESHAGAVLAVPPYAAARLLRDLPAADGSRELLSMLQAYRYQPIATLTLKLLGAWRLPRPMMMLNEDASRGHHGQWLFDRSWLAGRDSDCEGELAVVVSAAGAVREAGRTGFGEGLVEQVRAQLARHPARLPPMPEVAARALVVEKRATFSAVPGLARPPARTPWPRLVLAGDWTDTGYPGVLEGAVRSGLRAARALDDALSAGRARYTAPAPSAPATPPG